MNSMTGFGRSEGVIGGTVFTIEVKSVNHRYLDARFRLPSSISQFEIPLTEILRSYFDRGSFEIYVKQKLQVAESSVSGTTRIVLDELALKTFLESCEIAHKKFKTERVPSLEALALTNRVFLAQEESADFGQHFGAFKQLFEKALTETLAMRKAEGARLKKILGDGLKDLSRIVDQFASLASGHPAKVLEKLKSRISQWQLATPETQRVEWEVAFYADRADITEEIDRLKAHINEFHKLIDGPKSMGRKLDFLTQELHREVNTISSKATSIEITKQAVEAKTAIEKLREQIQNVE